MDPLAFTSGDPIPLPARFARIKASLTAGRTALVHDSWRRLLAELRSETELIADLGSDIIPTIRYEKLADEGHAGPFRDEFCRRGAAVVRGVVPPDEAARWQDETRAYLTTNPRARSFPTRDPHLSGVYWTPAQIRARAHPNVLATQRFAMDSMWHAWRDPAALVSTRIPVTYADRARVPLPASSANNNNNNNMPGGSAARTPYRNGHVDGGSVERWEPDGYGRAGTYDTVFEGRWEDYDPWESSTRLRVTSDLYNGAGSCSMLRMFQGWLSIAETSNRGEDANGGLLLCPMLKLSTAYFLLRPFFSPRVPLATAASSAAYLKEENWVLENPPSSVIQGALPSYTQELNEVLHPHLKLGATMVRIPALQPGDYVLWHADLVYGLDHRETSSRGNYYHQSQQNQLHHSAHQHHQQQQQTHWLHSHHRQQVAAQMARSNASRMMMMMGGPPEAADHDVDVDDDYSDRAVVATALYIPACPLTQTNALYLARQRKSFLLGQPPPDFGAGGHGESAHMGRPGVHEINEAGGEVGLRAMGLMPWEEDEAVSIQEREVLRMANGILFPDRYDMM